MLITKYALTVKEFDKYCNMTSFELPPLDGQSRKFYTTNNLIMKNRGEDTYFKYAKGIIFGRFGIEASNTYENLIDCLKDGVISKLDIPIIYNADVSHKGPCLNIINGVITEIEVKNNKGKVKFNIFE